MGLFRPYEQGKREAADEQAPAASGRRKGRGGATAAPAPADRQPSEPVTVTEPEATAPTRTTGPKHPPKKGTRTPTRAEAEAARMERLHPTLTPKEQRKAEREANREARMRQLDSVERAPERSLLRDHIDSRFTVLEFTMPVFMALIIVLLFIAPRNLALQFWMNIFMFVLLLSMAFNAWLVWRSYKRIAVERGLDPKQRGLLMYGVNRMMALRPLRNPRPRIKRGEKY